MTKVHSKRHFNRAREPGESLKQAARRLAFTGSREISRDAQRWLIRKEMSRGLTKDVAMAKVLGCYWAERVPVLPGTLSKHNGRIDG